MLNSEGNNCPYITGKDIFGNRINVTEKTDMISEETVALINKRAHLESGLLLFASTGTGTVGRMAIIEEYNNDWNMSETLYAIKVNPDILNAEYLMYILYSGVAKRQFEPKITKGSVPHLKVADLMAVRIPIPSLEDQARIVQRLSSFTQTMDTLSVAITNEIELRNAQYKYFQESIFSFKKAS